jgi:hypothetical protein
MFRREAKGAGMVKRHVRKRSKADEEGLPAEREGQRRSLGYEAEAVWTPSQSVAKGRHLHRAPRKPVRVPNPVIGVAVLGAIVVGVPVAVTTIQPNTYRLPESTDIPRPTSSPSGLRTTPPTEGQTPRSPDPLNPGLQGRGEPPAKPKAPAKPKIPAKPKAPAKSRVEAKPMAPTTPKSVDKGDGRTAASPGRHRKPRRTVALPTRAARPTLRSPSKSVERATRAAQQRAALRELIRRGLIKVPDRSDSDRADRRDSDRSDRRDSARRGSDRKDKRSDRADRRDSDRSDRRHSDRADRRDSDRADKRSDRKDDRCQGRSHGHHGKRHGKHHKYEHQHEKPRKAHSHHS